MRFFWIFARAYPARTALVLVSLLFGVMVEGVGISTLLMLLVVLAGGDGASGGEPSRLEVGVRGLLDAVGVEPTIGNLVALFIAVTMLQAALVLLSKQQVGFTAARIATDLRLLLIRTLAAARWSYFTRQPVGSLASSVSREAARGSGAYLSAANVLTAAAQALLYGSLALFVSWQVTLAALVAGAVAMTAVLRFIRLARRLGRKENEVRRRLLAHLTDGLQALKPLKAMARESLMGPLLERDARRINKLQRKTVIANETPRSIQQPLNACFAALGIYVAATRWQVPFAELTVLALLFINTVGKLTRAQRNYQTLVNNEQAARALRRTIKEATAHREERSGTQQHVLEREVSIEDVTFRYGEHTVLAGASLEIPAGSITALVGPSGAGKTSLADLVCGLVAPDVGGVRVDGVPLEEIDLTAWRRSIGYVPQEVFLINDSVRENITLGEELPNEAVEEALRRAGAWDFVQGLPEGAETSVGERGAQLSGGQRQRICIARALVHDPKLLILDEATTALDPETEARIWESILQLRGEVTVLAVSHQKRLMRVADRIYRVEDQGVERVAPSGQAAEPTSLAATQ